MGTEPHVLKPEARLRLRVGRHAGVGHTQARDSRLKRSESQSSKSRERERGLSAVRARDAVGPAG